MKRFNTPSRFKSTQNDKVQTRPTYHRTLHHVLSEDLRPEARAAARIYGRVSNLQVESLRLRDWNGYVELTDECRFGLALFDVKCDSLKTSITVPLKDIQVRRDINIILMRDLSRCEITLNDGAHVAMPLPYLDAFTEDGVRQFIHETRMVGKLVSDIKATNSVRDRWIPNFIQGIDEIEDVLNDTRYLTLNRPELLGDTLFMYPPRTIGQYLLLAMCERLRLRISGGMGLKVLFYAISLIARFALDGNMESLNVLLIDVVIWITRGTCDDCLVKVMRYLHGSRAFEYSYYLNDSFSKFIDFDFNPIINIDFGSCDETSGATHSIVNSPTRLKNLTLKTIGRHSFLISPEASKRVRARIIVSQKAHPVTLYPTARQLMSLITILDLHSRVLRAHDWNQSVHAFNAWFAERRIDMTSDSNDLMDVLILDLIEIRRLCPGMDIATSHLIILLSRGVLPREMIMNYNQRPTGMRAHEFIVNFVFYVSPSGHLKQLADVLFARLANATKEERLLEISFTIENPRHSYEICPAGVVSAVSRKMNISQDDRLMVIESTVSDAQSETLTNSTEYLELPARSNIYPALNEVITEKANSEADLNLPELPSHLITPGTSSENRVTVSEMRAVVRKLGLQPIETDDDLWNTNIAPIHDESMINTPGTTTPTDTASISLDDNIYISKGLF